MGRLFCHRTLPAYRPYFTVFYEDWIESRTVLHSLDLAVPSKILSMKLYGEKVLSEKDENNMAFIKVMEQFYSDDCIYVGVPDRRRDFFSNVMSKREDRIGRELFDLFCDRRLLSAEHLESGDSAVRFLNMAKVFGVGKWKKTDGRIGTSHHPVVDGIILSIYPAVLKGVYKKKLEHPLLLKTFWDEFCVTDRIRLILFELVPDAEHLEFMLEVANRTRFDFWGMRNGSKGLTQRIVPAYIRMNKFEWVEILLEYGFALENGTPDATSKKLWDDRIGYSFLIFDWDLLDLPISNIFLMWLLANIYDVTQPDLDLDPRFIELYQKLYRSLPLPSSDPPSVFRKNLEIAIYQTEHHYAAAAGRPRRGDENEFQLSEVLDDITQAYVECDVHPSDDERTPRKLSVLSRCVIRQQLAANYQLPKAIGEFYLPTTTKNFLRLDVNVKEAFSED